MKFPPENLNLSPYLPHLTSTYTCRVTITPKMCNSKIFILLTKSGWVLYLLSFYKFCLILGFFLFIIIKSSNSVIRQGRVWYIPCLIQERKSCLRN